MSPLDNTIMDIFWGYTSLSYMKYCLLAGGLIPWLLQAFYNLFFDIPWALSTVVS